MAICWCARPNFNKKKCSVSECKLYLSMAINEKFYEDIKNANLSSDSKLIILCRSGGRSKSAAEFLTSKGFNHCYNCVHGFEGAQDEYKYRSNKAVGNLTNYHGSKFKLCLEVVMILPNYRSVGIGERKISKIGEVLFKSWFKPLTLIRYESDVLILGVPNNFVRTRLSKNIMI